jgi:methylated-DNA-[protein]-cysteine S-methyltransferase
MSLFYKEIDSIVGKLKLVANDHALVAILWEKEKPNRVKLGNMAKNERHPILLKAEKQLIEYFLGQRRAFEIPLELSGTDFQLNVWQALRQVSYGKTISYGELAMNIGKPKAIRAVGTAVGRNPISILIPCHRIIGANGSLTGFAGGLHTKDVLLSLEDKGLSSWN